MEPLAVSTKVVILQHPKEQRKKIGTGRMTHQFLPNSLLLVSWDFDEDPTLSRLLEDPGNQCFVLYPGPESRELSGPGDLVGQVPGVPVVFVIDGTWACARKMIKWSTKLSGLRQVRLPPGAASEYGIRRQPRPECLSTIEAVHRLLQIVELEECRPKNEVMLKAFREMVRRQKLYQTAK